MDYASPSAAQRASQDQLFGHPRGLYVCFFTELWERWSFYGMKYLLVLYLTKYHLFSDAAGLHVLGAYAGLVYALPVIGGLLADRYLGMRKAVVFGGILLSLGHILMAVEGHQAVNYAAGTMLSTDLALANGTVLAAGTTLTEAVTMRDTAALNVFYFALALIICGVGFLKPNVSTIVGNLYEKDDPRRDSGFTIFYMGINIGSFFATALCGYLGETYGWKYGFGAAGLGMILGVVMFLRGQKHLYGCADPSDPEMLREKVFGPLSREWLIYLATLPMLALMWWMVQHEHIVLASQNVMLVIAITGLLAYAMLHRKDDSHQRNVFVLAGITVAIGVVAALAATQVLPISEGTTSILTYVALAALAAFAIFGFAAHNSHEYGRTFTLMVLIMSTVVFWALFEQSAASMTLYADRVVDRQEIVAGWVPTASQFGSLNALFIMLLAIPFAMLWTFLDRYRLNPSVPVKFAYGIALAGLGFGALVFGAQFANDAGKVAMIWLVLAYLLHTSGELCLSPVGLSAVTKLSISKVVGVSMGTWFLATALSETLAARISAVAAIDTSGGAVAVSGAEALAIYTELFTFLMWLGLGVGLFMLVISPLLKRLMHGVR